MLDESSVYVGIFAQRYGAVTIEELRYAQELGLPILAFFAEQQLNERDVEADPARAQELAAIKQELREQAHCGRYFRTADELGIEGAALAADDARRRQTGRHRDEPAPVETGPHAPAPYYAHPYIGGSRFVGRKNELGLLDAWVDLG